MTHDREGEVQRPPPRSRWWVGWLLSGGFGILAIVLFARSHPIDLNFKPSSHIDPSSLVVKPLRTAMKDPASVIVEGRGQSCQGCHQIFEITARPDAAIHYHTEIALNHGLNNRCVNCHSAENIEQLTLRDSTTVPFAQTAQLCAQCHGTVYRDWERGTHGKTLGSWITHSDAQRRLRCNECHNPHSPRYEPFVPLPGPNTWRMGSDERPVNEGQVHEDTGEKQSPLQRWLHSARARQAHDGGHPGGNP